MNTLDYESIWVDDKGMPGLQVTMKNREQILALMEEFVRTRKLKLNSERLIVELLTFIVNEQGKPEADEGCHDDLVMSLAIACYGLKDLVSSTPHPWNWNCLSSHPNITWENVKEDLASDNPHEWDDLSENPNITWEIVQEDLASPNPHDWNWWKLSRNSNITWEIVKEDLSSNHPHTWIWCELSSNPSITLENIREDLASDTPHKWRWDHLSGNTFGWKQQPLIKPALR